MKSIENMLAKRLFSLNFYKNLKLPLGEMSFSKDFVNETRGDIYPVVERSADFCEKISSCRYFGEGEKLVRILGSHLPYCTYEMTFSSLCGKGGFSFLLPDSKASTLMGNKNGKVFFEFSENGNMQKVETAMDFVPGSGLVVTARKNNFDIYYKKDGFPNYVCTFCAESFKSIAYQKVFEKCSSAVILSGKSELADVSFYIDCGISQADIRPVRYENGEILIENGKVFLTASIRMQAECFQGIFSWVPGTSNFELCGALFYDAGDGMWGNDVAASLMFDRYAQEWKLWVCSFCHDHILAYARFDGDIRFGVNVLDITLMEKMKKGDCDELFRSKIDDEDPDFIFDEKNGKWYLSVCRAVGDGDSRSYRYFFFESESDAFSGYKFIGRTDCGGAETGGSILNLDGKFKFVCGSSFDVRAEYRIYNLFDGTKFTKMTFDHDDGGFRGWGSIIPIKYGSRTRYFHLTFDRAGGSDYTWSYGNIYCFELIDKQ